MPKPQEVSRGERREVELARQFAASADVLWYAGHRSAGIHHAERSLFHALRVVPGTDRESTPSPSPDLDSSAEHSGVAKRPPSAESVTSDELSSEGQTVARWLGLGLSALSDAERERLQKAAEQFEGQRVPAADDDVPLRAGAYFRALLQIQQTTLRPHLHKLHTRFGVWLRRFRSVLLVLIVAAFATYAFTRPPVPATASASASFSATYPASAVLDGKFDSRTSEWILPHSRKVGWVEVKLGTPETIDQVRIKNASHPPHHTYGTKTFRLEAYEGGKLAFKQEGSFGEPNVKSPWFTSSKIGKKVDRIRVYVLTNYGPAGGIAEIAWD